MTELAAVKLLLQLKQTNVNAWLLAFIIDRHLADTSCWPCSKRPGLYRRVRSVIGDVFMSSIFQLFLFDSSS